MLKQLTKKELLELDDGVWEGQVVLSKIPDIGRPLVYMSNFWFVEIDKMPRVNQYAISKSSLLKAKAINWPQYDVKSDATDSGDLVFEDFLMQLFVEEK